MNDFAPPTSDSSLPTYTVPGDCLLTILFITEGAEGREDKKEGREATRSYGKSLEESANRALSVVTVVSCVRLRSVRAALPANRYCMACVDYCIAAGSDPPL